MKMLLSAESDLLLVI